VNEIQEAPGVIPRSVIITGDDFASVETVLLNQFPAPEFVQYAPHKILAQVPDQVRDDVIRDVMVLSTALTLTDKSLVEFTVGTRPKKVNGILRLIQIFIRMLLRTGGSNIFHTRLGGGLQKKVGATIGGAGRDRVIGDAILAVANTRQQIISAQTPDRNIPVSERLLGAEVGGVDYDLQSGTLFMTIILTNYSGRRGAATLVA
jgi:hypothetical protein